MYFKNYNYKAEVKAIETSCSLKLYYVLCEKTDDELLDNKDVYKIEVSPFSLITFLGRCADQNDKILFSGYFRKYEQIINTCVIGARW